MYNLAKGVHSPFCRPGRWILHLPAQSSLAPVARDNHEDGQTDVRVVCVACQGHRGWTDGLEVGQTGLRVEWVGTHVSHVG